MNVQELLRAHYARQNPCGIDNRVRDREIRRRQTNHLHVTGQMTPVRSEVLGLPPGSIVHFPPNMVYILDQIPGYDRGRGENGRGVGWGGSVRGMGRGGFGG